MQCDTIDGVGHEARSDGDGPAEQEGEGHDGISPGHQRLEGGGCLTNQSTSRVVVTVSVEMSGATFYFCTKKIGYNKTQSMFF